MFDKLKTFISKKLLAAVLTAAFLAVNNNLTHPLDAATVKDIINVAIAYILGQSAVDLATVVKNGK